jgi:hypothetical protein
MMQPSRRRGRGNALSANADGQPGDTHLLDQLARAMQRLESITPSPSYRDEYRGLDMPAVAANTVGPGKSFDTHGPLGPGCRFASARG